MPLFYFWVLLSTKYQALSPFDYALFEDPQKQKILDPILRSNTGNLWIEWERVMSRFLKDPVSVNNKLIEYAMKKFQQTSELNASKNLKHYSK